MSVGVNMQLEGNGGGDTIDESYLIVKGGFGEINLGSENSALYKMHYSAKGYGIGFNLVTKVPGLTLVVQSANQVTSVSQWDRQTLSQTA